MKQKPKTYGERISHAFAGSRQNPDDASAVNPLDGSGLFSESAGRIRLLFSFDPTTSPTPQSIGVQPLAPGLTPRIKTSLASTFAPFITNMGAMGVGGNFATMVYYRLWKNEIPVTEWLPVTMVSTIIGTYGQPISPNASAVLFTASTFINDNGARIYLARISFDAVEFFNTNTAVAANLQAYIADGHAALIPSTSGQH